MKGFISRSVAEFIAQVCRIRDDWGKAYSRAGYAEEWQPWFRGEPLAVCDTPLVPRLYRPLASLRRLLLLEQELRLEFKRCVPQLAPGMRPANHWDWYFMMQHYGAPTRLLDWSDGALIGLLFAVVDRVRNRHSGSIDAAVYMLDPRWLNKLAFKPNREGWEGVALPDWRPAKKYLSEDELQNADNLRVKLPIAIDPDHLSSRLSAQRSRFVLFGRDRQNLARLLRVPHARLLRISIPSSYLGSVWSDLRTGGTSRASVFPELQGLGDDLYDWFNHRLTR